MDSRDYLASLFDLSGRTAIVTGASSGLGAEMARVLVRAGARVLLVARRAERLAALADELGDCPGAAVPLAADLASEGDLDRIVREADQVLGGCDILVANAGQVRAQAAEALDRAAFEGVVGLNLTAAALLAGKLFPLLRAADQGRVIHIASIYGIGGPVRPGLASYAASKHAVVGLTRAQAIEWGRHGITVNAIAPGYFPTEINEALLSDPEAAERFKTFTPLGRFGRPAELAPVLLLLASPASSYVTGAVIPIDGGWSAW